jgi:hypothetical protein
MPKGKSERTPQTAKSRPIVRREGSLEVNAHATGTIGPEYTRSGVGRSIAEWKGELLPEVETAFPKWKHQNLDEVYDEVNDLKHTPEGKFGSREVDLKGAKAAIEELLELFERWCGLWIESVSLGSSPIK